MKLSHAILAATLFATACDQSQPASQLIPLPRQVEYQRGSFNLKNGLRIAAADSVLISSACYLATALSTEKVGARMTDSAVNCRLVIDPALAQQAYRLQVTANGIELFGGDTLGISSGIATLRQLLWQNTSSLRLMTIEDAPRFAWRGVMLDVSRHFFTPEEVRRLLDRMALYKFNRLHLHLTDDQGWRMEIRRYPELTQKGAWRAFNKLDSLCLQRAEEQQDDKYRLPEDRLRTENDEVRYGGFYTQDELRELVAYATQRGIEIIPELDFPGHSLAAIAAIPSLACDGRGSWGKDFSTPLCLGRNATLEFCRNVLTEVFELFPTRYVHIGGDEVDRTAWNKCPDCQRRIAQEHLGGVEALQPWFTRELERFCTAHDHTLIGWDEVADDGLSSKSVVMWWRSWMPTTLNESLQEGHPVILTPSEFMYLDNKQERNSLAKVYRWDPSSEAIATCDSLVWGLQANLWAEHVPSIEVVGERIFPRLLAVSEIAWSAAAQRSFPSFLERLPLHLQQLDAAGWNYRLFDVEGVCDDNVFLDSLRIDLRVPEEATLYYAINDSVPTFRSIRYTEPFYVSKDCTISMRCYNARGIAADVHTISCKRADYLAAQSNVGTLQSGVLARWYDYKGVTCGGIDKSPLLANFTVDKIAIPEGVSGNIGLVFDGYINIPTTDIYSFYTYSDDGSTLRIDDQLVVNNDGAHSRVERSGQAALSRGIHKFSVRYFDSNGGVLEVGMIDRDGNRIPIDSELLKH